MQAATNTALSFNVEKIRADFPILHRQINGKPRAFDAWLALGAGTVC